MDENAIIEIIIEEVCKRLFLWSKLDKCHSDKIKCRNAWTAIAAKAGLEDDDVKKKWKNLRDKFAKVQKKLPSGSSAQANQYWPWADSLSFLGEAPECRKTASNLDESKEEDVGQEDQDTSNAADALALSDTLEQLHDEHDRSDISKSGKFTEPKEFKRRKRSYQPDIVDEALLKYLKEKSGDKDDEDLLFVKSIGASLAKLNPCIKCKAKLAILQVINDAEEEQEQQVVSTNQANIQHAHSRSLFQMQHKNL